MPLEDGFVEREAVIRVLRFHGISVSPQINGPVNMMILAKDDYIEAREFPLEVGRQLLHYFQRKFKIQIHLFYHPEMLPPDPTCKLN